MSFYPPPPGSRRLDVHHIPSQRLAELVAGDQASDTELVHLSYCRACAAGHADLVRLQAEITTGAHAAPDEFLEAGHAYVDREIGSSAGSATREGTRRPRSGARRWLSTLVPSLAAAAVLLLVFWPRADEPLPDGSQLPDPVRQALVRDSAFGMVHPLVSGAGAFEAPVVRGPGQRDSLDGAVESLMQQHLLAPSDLGRTSALVAGFQAAEQERNARSYLEEARAEHPDDRGLEMLEIVQDYLEGDLDRAELALRKRLDERGRDDLAQLNLAILLDARGAPADREESQRLARELVERLPGGGIALRARRLLD